MIWVYGLLLGMAVVVSYAVSCWLWPLAACTKCDGGKIRRPDGRVWRECRRCKGSGKRIRVGRRLFNWWHGRYRATR